MGSARHSRSKVRGGKAGGGGTTPQKRTRANVIKKQAKAKGAAPKVGESNKVPKHLRLLNLMLYMINHTDRGNGASYDDIAQIPGYDHLGLAKDSQKSSKAAKRDEESLRRMFERDRHDLRKIGLDIKARSSTRSIRMREFYLDRRSMLTKPVGLVEAELMLLDMVVSSFEGESGHDLANLARVGLAKLKSSADVIPRREVESMTQQRLTNREEESKAMEALQLAYSKRVACRLKYLTPGKGPAKRRVLEPYGFVLRGTKSYLVAREVDSGSIKNFRLSRMRGKIELLPKETYQIPKSFKLESHFSPKLFVGDPDATVNVVVRFDRDVGFIIANIFEGQVMMSESTSKGTVTATFPTAYPNELFRVLSEYAGHFEVVKPAAIKRQFRVHLQDTLANYQEGSR